MEGRGFEYGDTTAVRKVYADLRKEMNKQLKQIRTTDFLYGKF